MREAPPGWHKPIVVVKSGRTGAGRRAASSHTAAMAARETAVEAMVHQAGVIRAGTAPSPPTSASAPRPAPWAPSGETTDWCPGLKAGEPA